MLRRLLPYMLIVLLVMIDTSVVPVFTDSVYVIPLTLMFVMCAGMLLGRTHGMLSGLLGGLLIDILTGYPVGYMMIAYIACGFFAGLFACDTDEMRAQEGYSRTKAFFRRALVAGILFALLETVTIIYQYFHTALLLSRYFVLALIRVGIGTAFCSGLYYLLDLMIFGRTNARVRIGGSKREVRNL